MKRPARFRQSLLSLSLSPLMALSACGDRANDESAAAGGAAQGRGGSQHSGGLDTQASTGGRAPSPDGEAATSGVREASGGAAAGEPSWAGAAPGAGTGGSGGDREETTNGGGDADGGALGGTGPLTDAGSAGVGGAGGATASCTPISAPLVQHSCGHTTSGPFATQVAHPLDEAPFRNISAPHTAFTVVLPELSDAVGQYAGTIGYRPATAGYYAFFFDAMAVPLAVDVNDAAVSEIAVQDVTPAECPLIDGARVYWLSDGASAMDSYRLTLGPSSISQPVLIIEYIGSKVSCTGASTQ